MPSMKNGMHIFLDNIIGKQKKQQLIHVLCLACTATQKVVAFFYAAS
jgi:hypothetical protein